MKRIKPKPQRKSTPPVLNGRPKRDTRWKPGQSGNPDTQFKPGVVANPAGRPMGARSRLNDAFLEALGEAWVKHGPAALEWLAQNDKTTFVQVVSSLIPRNAKLDVELAAKPIYVIADRPMTNDEWVKEYCDVGPPRSELQ